MGREEWPCWPERAPLCVNCGRGVKSLYREYSKDNIRLTRCEHCGGVADKYIEYELILIVLDLALHKLQAYRHLLFNRHPYCDLSFSGLLRVTCALIVLHTHIKYAISVYDSPFSLQQQQPPPLSGADTLTNTSTMATLVDPTDNPKDQIQLIMRIFLVSLLEFVAFTVIVVLTSLIFASITVPTPLPPYLPSPSLPSSSSPGAPIGQQHLSTSSSFSNTEGGPFSSHQRQPPPPPPPPPLSAQQSQEAVEGRTWFIVEKLLKAVLYPNFGRLLVVFVMIWDQQIIVANIISVLVLTSQYRALQAVREPPYGFGTWQEHLIQLGGPMGAGLLGKAIVTLSMANLRPPLSAYLF